MRRSDGQGTVLTGGGASTVAAALGLSQQADDRGLPCHPRVTGYRRDGLAHGAFEVV